MLSQLLVTFAFLLLIFVTTTKLFKTMHFNRLNREKLSFVLSQMPAFLCHLNPAEEWGCGFVTWEMVQFFGPLCL